MLLTGSLGGKLTPANNSRLHLHAGSSRPGLLQSKDQQLRATADIRKAELSSPQKLRGRPKRSYRICSSKWKPSHVPSSCISRWFQVQTSSGETPTLSHTVHVDVQLETATTNDSTPRMPHSAVCQAKRIYFVPAT